MRAAIYLRVSTAGQSGPDHISLSVQEEACRAYVLRQGGEVVAVLRDEGRSGLDNERPAYLQLFQLANSCAIDSVVAYRLDRLGRDAAELLTATKTLRGLGVAVASATEPTESNLVAGMLALLAEDESARIRARTVPAMLSRLAEGKWVTHAPLGYDIVAAQDGGKTLRPNDDAWKLTRLFEIYAAGKHSLRDLALEAAILGLRLDRAQLSRHMRNPAYIGKTVWGRREKLSPRHSRARAAGEWYEAQGLHPAIVDADVFERVQSMLRLNRERQGPPSPTRQLLIGRLRCGACGAPMFAIQRKTSRYPDKLFHSYKCPRHHDRLGCPQGTLATWMADDQVKAELSRSFQLGGVEARRRAETIIASERDSYLDSMAQRKTQLQRALRRQESDQRTLTRKLARGVVGERAYREAYTEIESLAASIRRELEDLVDVTVPDISAALAYVSTLDWGDLTQESWREVILGFCERIDLTGREVAVTWTQEAMALRRVLAAAVS